MGRFARFGFCFARGFGLALLALREGKFREFPAGAGEQCLGDDESEQGDSEGDGEAGLADEWRAQPCF